MTAERQRQTICYDINNWGSDRLTDRETDRQTDRLIDRQIERQTDRPTDRQKIAMIELKSSYYVRMKKY